MSRTQTVAFDARYVNDRYHGIGRHAYHLFEALSRLDPSRHYLAIHNPAYPNSRFDLGRLGERPDVEVRALGLKLYRPAEQVVWPMVLARCGAALFHTPYVALPLLAPVKLVMTIHDLIFERFPAYMPQRWLRGVYRAQTLLGARRAAAILTVSVATRADVETYYGAGRKTRVIRNAVDSTFRPVDDPARRTAVRERYGLPERFVLTLGAGRPHKNVEMLVEALARLGPDRGVALVLAGEFDERFEDGVANAVRARGLGDRVRLTGLVRDGDRPTLYSLAEVFAFPSLVEGFGLPPLEAMACGAPVVASKASSIPEVVGDAGLLFDPRDPEDLAATLARVLERPAVRAELSRRGRARAAVFTWDRVARATLAVYDELLGLAPASTGRLVNTL